MKKSYEIIEKAVLDAMICKPELIKNTKLEDKHFKNHRRLWLFIKECYKRFGMIDVPTMARICPNESEMIDYIADIMDTGSSYVRFSTYEDFLIELYEDFEEIEQIYSLAKKLYIRDIKLEEFKKEIKELIGNEEQS